MRAINNRYVTMAEYLANEERATVKHEYVDGQVYAMTGAVARHRTIAGNIFSALRAHLRGSRCRADIADAKVKVEATNSCYYPDVVVSCGAYDDKSVFAIKPVFIVEVLSRSTSTIDRREKLFAYRKIDSLKEYMIVYQRTQRVELHRKKESGLWEMFEFRQGGIVLESIPVGPLTLTFDAIYEDVQWQQTAGWQVREEASSYATGEELPDW